MPIYNLKRISTGEEFEVQMTWDELQDTLKEDVDLYQMLSTPKISGRPSRDNVSKAGSEWRDLLGGIKKVSGEGNTIKV